MVNGNELANAGFKYLGRSYEEMDCQKFVERCLKDCGNNTDLAGSNAWYRKVMNEGWVGTPEECKAKYGSVPKGAFLFILEHDGKEPSKYHGDGIGNASHIGIVTGQGQGAIHSSKSRGGVCESKFQGKSISGGWNRVGLWTNAVDYSGVTPGPSPDPGPDPEPTPEPEPEPQTATVWSANGKHVHLRKAKSTSSKVVDDVPCGATVEVQEYGDDWCKVKYVDKRVAKWYGYMMTSFLRFNEELPQVDPSEEEEDEDLDGPTGDEEICVVIPCSSMEEADAICEKYPGAYRTVG